MENIGYVIPIGLVSALLAFLLLRRLYRKVTKRHYQLRPEVGKVYNIPFTIPVKYKVTEISGNEIFGSIIVSGAPGRYEIKSVITDQQKQEITIVLVMLSDGREETLIFSYDEVYKLFPDMKRINRR